MPIMRLFLTRVVMWMVVLTVAIAAVGVFLVWVTRSIDIDAVERQRSLAELAINKFHDDIGRQQESSTVWDEAAKNTAQPRDLAWIDENLGTWMHTFYGMDELYLLDGHNEAFYAFADGEIRATDTFASRSELLRPLIARLREKIANGDGPPPDSGQQSVGVTEFMFVGTHPAVVGVKPIISDSLDDPPPPDGTVLHVAIRYVEGAVLDGMSKSYGLDDFSVEPALTGHDDRPRIIVKDSKGRAILDFHWLPYQPGKRLLVSLSPILALVTGALFIGMLLLLSISYRRQVDRRRSEAHIRYLATHDLLTGLGNRAACEEAADHMVADVEAQPPEDQAAFLFMDIDRFKQVNDLYGHQTGDTVLIEFAKRVLAVTPEHAALYRVGGDEFTMLVPRCQPLEIEDLCAHIIDSMSTPILCGDSRVFAGASIGVAFSPLHGTDRSELNRKADVALYDAKTSGRGRFSIFGIQMDETIQNRGRLEVALREAMIDMSQMTIHYQPKFSRDGHTIHGVEALLRWTHRDSGAISPSVFIPVAESAGLIGKLGTWVLERACRQALDWPIDHLAVNVSPKQLEDAGFVETVLDVLKRTGFPPERLELEITETVLTGAVALSNIERLVALNISIAIDDFGTGSSTFERLREISFDRIKIDRSFVRNIRQSRGDAEIVQAMVTLAHARGLQTTAEGVETAEQMEVLCALGCDELQGYLLGRPMSAEALSALFGPMESKTRKTG